MTMLDPAHFGVLRRETKAPPQFKVVGFDSEDDTKGRPIAFTFHDGESSFYTKDPRKAVKYIIEYPVPAIFCAHNLEYDIGNLFKASGFKWVDRMIYASRLLRVSLKFSKSYFLNSAAFFPGSLKAMGKVVGLLKLDGDPFSKEYAERDAEIVQRYMSRLQQKLFNDYGAGLGVSIGQISMEVYRRCFMPEKSQVTWVHPEALAAYYGGRVEMFYKGLLNEEVNVADFNSCYPYVMRHRDYPDTSTLRKTSLDEDIFGIGKFTVMVPKSIFVPPLPYRNPSSNRLYFPTGLFTGWWTFHEMRRAEAMGCKVVREWEAYGTSVAVKPFDAFIDHFYTHREGAKKRLQLDPDDEVALFESTYDKLLMNNLYGKLGQHKPSQVLSRTPLPAKVLEQYPDVKMHRVEPFYSYTLSRAKAPATANYLWGIYVTAYSRLHLLDHLVKVADTPGCRLVYTDTDSVMYTGKADLKFGSALGEMSLEKFQRGIFRSSKGYLLLNQQADGTWLTEKVACKGVPTAYALDFVVKGTAEVRKPQRLKEALIQLQSQKVVKEARLGAVKVSRKRKGGETLEREIGINVWDDVRKEMRSVYIKRKGAMGITYPIGVDEIEAAEKSALAGEEALELDIPEDMQLVAKYKPSTAFLDIKIPPGWYDEEPLTRGEFRELESVNAHYLRANECEVLLPGEVWVSGKIIGIQKTKKSELYKINVVHYLEQEMDSGSMVALLRPSYLYHEECEEEIIGQELDITLKTEYIKGRSLNLRIELHEA